LPALISSAVRVAGLEAKLEALGHVVEDSGNIAVAIPEQKRAGDPNAKYLKEIVATCTKEAELVLKTLEAGFGLAYLNHAADDNVPLMSDLFAPKSH